VTPVPKPKANIAIFAAEEISLQNTSEVETANIKNNNDIPTRALFDFIILSPFQI